MLHADKSIQIKVSSGVPLAPADQAASESGKYREWKSREEFGLVRRKNLTRRNI